MQTTVALHGYLVRLCRPAVILTAGCRRISQGENVRGSRTVRAKTWRPASVAGLLRSNRKKGVLPYDLGSVRQGGRGLCVACGDFNLSKSAGNWDNSTGTCTGKGRGDFKRHEILPGGEYGAAFYN